MEKTGLEYSLANQLLIKNGSVRAALENSMNKEKLANGVMWVSVAMLFIFTAALSTNKRLPTR